jgi:hypothetical protein
MTTADTASIITAWSEEGLSYKDALKRAPMWDDSVNPKPREECNKWLCMDMGNGFQMIALPPREECNEWLRTHIENGFLVLQGCDAQNDQLIQIRPSMVRHLHFDAIKELMHGLGRTFYDLRVFAADKLKAAEVDPFRTGAAGRPTAKHVILEEFERMLGAEEVEPTEGGLTKFAQDIMAPWWETRRLASKGPSVKPRTIVNMLREPWRKALAVKRTKSPS